MGPHLGAQPCIFTFANTSRVYQAEQRLSRAGFAVGLRPIPSGVPSRCGLCIQGRLADLVAMVAVLDVADDGGDRLSGRPTGSYCLADGETGPWRPLAEGEIHCDPHAIIND